MFTGREPTPAGSFWEAAVRRQSFKLVWDRGR
jgi:hypothetical protein